MDTPLAGFGQRRRDRLTPPVAQAYQMMLGPLMDRINFLQVTLRHFVIRISAWHYGFTLPPL